MGSQNTIKIQIYQNKYSQKDFFILISESKKPTTKNQQQQQQQQQQHNHNEVNNLKFYNYAAILTLSQ